MRGLSRTLALVVVLGLIFLGGMGLSSPGRSGADQHAVATTTTAAPATTTTAAPATTTTAAPATTTTAAPATTTTAAPATTTTTAAPATPTTTAPTATTAPPDPSTAGTAPADALADTGAARTTARRSPSRIVREPAPNRPTTREFRRAREAAPPLEPPGDAGPRLNLGPLFEPDPARAATAGAPERGGLATEPLATGGLVLGALAGLLLGLADRAAGLSTRGR